MRYYPFGETRYSSGTTATSKRFTSQEEQIDIGRYDYGARFYAPSLARFISTDSVVPQPGDPQSLNRYSYVRNSPLTRIDPSGHEDCKNGDNVCWQNQWMWKNRWYEAHGIFWTGGGWNKRDTARFADEGILRQTVKEANISFVAGIFKEWQFWEMIPIAQGIVALGYMVGGFSHLKDLLGGYALLQRDNTSLADRGAYTEWWGGSTQVVHFQNTLFNCGVDGSRGDYVRGAAVHELAHLIDYHYAYASARIPLGYPVSPYAKENAGNLEYFARAIAFETAIILRCPKCLASNSTFVTCRTHAAATRCCIA